MAVRTLSDPFSTIQIPENPFSPHPGKVILSVRCLRTTITRSLRFARRLYGAARSVCILTFWRNATSHAIIAYRKQRENLIDSEGTILLAERCLWLQCQQRIPSEGHERRTEYIYSVLPVFLGMYLIG